MSDLPGLSHQLPDNESENAKRLRGQGIVATPQLELGSPVSLVKDGYQWSGFVLSIDRFGSDYKFIVFWSIKPTNADPRNVYGIFRMSQVSSNEFGAWNVDPATVP